MTKVKIFIDFEAISAPFSYDAKLTDDMPSAYSIGVFVGKKFKVRTTIINFNKVNDENIFEYMRLDINSKVRTLLSKKDFSINKDTTQFVAWAANLERKFLERTFRGVEVKDMVTGKALSLNTLTSDIFDDENYFTNLKTVMRENLQDTFILKRGLDKADGAVAALAGYLFYINARNIKGKYKFNVDHRILAKEFRKYSEDDVKRMGWLYEHPNEYHKRKIELVEKHSINQKISRELTNTKKLIGLLSEQDKKMTVGTLLNELEQKRDKLMKDKK